MNRKGIFLICMWISIIFCACNMRQDNIETTYYNENKKEELNKNLQNKLVKPQLENVDLYEGKIQIRDIVLTYPTNYFDFVNNECELYIDSICSEKLLSTCLVDGNSLQCAYFCIGDAIGKIYFENFTSSVCEITECRVAEIVVEGEGDIYFPGNLCCGNTLSEWRERWGTEVCMNDLEYMYFDNPLYLGETWYSANNYSYSLTIDKNSQEISRIKCTFPYAEGTSGEIEGNYDVTGKYKGHVIGRLHIPDVINKIEGNYVTLYRSGQGNKYAVLWKYLHVGGTGFYENYRWNENYTGIVMEQVMGNQAFVEINNYDENFTYRLTEGRYEAYVIGSIIELQGVTDRELLNSSYSNDEYAEIKQYLKEIIEQLNFEVDGENIGTWDAGITNDQKHVFFEVVNEDNTKVKYEIYTCEDELLLVMDKTIHLEYDGNELETGLFITSINGTEASWEKNEAYWEIQYNNDVIWPEWQCVFDGDVYRFVYTPYR